MLVLQELFLLINKVILVCLKGVGFEREEIMDFGFFFFFLVFAILQFY